MDEVRPPYSPLTMRSLQIAFSDAIFGRNDCDLLASLDPMDKVFTCLLA